MRCIGDECLPPGSGHFSQDHQAGRRFGQVLVLFSLSAGFGCALAPTPGDVEARHLRVLAPPVVLVSEIASP